MLISLCSDIRFESERKTCFYRFERIFFHNFFSWFFRWSSSYTSYHLCKKRRERKIYFIHKKRRELTTRRSSSDIEHILFTSSSSGHSRLSLLYSISLLDPSPSLHLILLHSYFTCYLLVIIIIVVVVVLHSLRRRHHRYHLKFIFYARNDHFAVFYEWTSERVYMCVRVSEGNWKLCGEVYI